RRPKLLTATLGHLPQVQSATFTHKHLLSITPPLQNVQTEFRASSSPCLGAFPCPELCHRQKSRMCTPFSRRRPVLLDTFKASSSPPADAISVGPP
ncbi:hypothetical protein PIB30_079639, partial [Stylosanthes scabra]|nr:hypothetical protein [Stylosanthes scabra]